MKISARWLALGFLTLAPVACGARHQGLRSWNPPPYFTPEKYAQVEGMKIAYVEAGENNPDAIIFVHGFSGDLQNWWDEFDYFRKNYHVLVLDNPGHGKSEKCSAQRPCSIDFFARVLVGLMDQRGIKQAVLVGNSMGGQIVGYVAIHYPERVTKLVLSDSAGASKLGPLALVIPFASPTNLKLLYNPKRDQYREDGPDKNQARNAFAKSFAGTDQERPYLVSLSQSIKSVAHTPLTKDLPKIAAPTLLIWGDDDPLVKPKTMDTFAAGIPHTTRYLVHRGGHTPQMHTPAEFNCAVENFIQGRDLETCHQNVEQAFLPVNFCLQGPSRGAKQSSCAPPWPGPLCAATRQAAVKARRKARSSSGSILPEGRSAGRAMAAASPDGASGNPSASTPWRMASKTAWLSCGSR